MNDTWDDGPSMFLALCPCGSERIDRRTPDSPLECYECGKEWLGLKIARSNEADIIASVDWVFP